MEIKRHLKVDDILLDPKNPRLDIQQGQAEILQIMAQNQGRKLIWLAEDIVNHGLNPTELPIVVPTGEAGKSVVVEGNRRIAALKLLADPDLATTTLGTRDRGHLKAISKDFIKSPIKKVECIVFERREEATHWIHLRHTGENKGAGVVPWNALERKRFIVRRLGKSEPETNLLQKIMEDGGLDKETIDKVERNFAITNFERVVRDKYVRERVGLARKGRAKGYLLINPEWAMQCLARIVSDIAHKRIGVPDIEHSGDRKKYIDNVMSCLQKENERDVFPGSDEPESSSDFSGRRSPATKARPNGNKQGGVDRPAGDLSQREIKPRKARRNLIPAQCRVPVSDSRVNEIYHELKRLDIDSFPNATAVLYRVFMELTVDIFLRELKIAEPVAIDNMKLTHKLEKSAVYIRDNEVMTEKELKPVFRSASNRHFGASVATLHSYVHNPGITPSSTEMKSAWDDMEKFFSTAWSMIGAAQKEIPLK